VRGLSFTLGRERLGIVGESDLASPDRPFDPAPHPPAGARLSADRIASQGKDLQTASTSPHATTIRGAGIAMVMQDPKYSLNPVMTVGEQIAEALSTHVKRERRDVRRRRSPC
jgi:peptide/nickel transport system ATP-binding protein